MGSLCCCFHAPDIEENVESNSSNHGNCMCPNCFFKSLTSKYGALFGRVEMHAAASSFQGAASSSSMVAPNNTRLDTGRHFPNTVNPENSNPQNNFVNMECRNGTSHSHLEPEVLRRNNVQTIPKINSGVDKQNGSYCGEESRECHSESSRKILLEKVESGVGSVCSAEDENVCPTCLEEYTPENPKIITQCRHNYHLSCIYEWMERSEKCPVCGKLMVFEETT